MPKIVLRALKGYAGGAVLPALVYAIITGTLLLSHTVLAGWGDPIEYLEGAENLANYDSAFHPPLYPVVTAGIRLVTGDVFLAGKLVSFLAGVAVIFLTWSLGKLCFNSSRVGLLGATLVALSPLMIRYGYVVGSDMLGVALFMVSLYALAVAGRGSARALAVAGVFGGLAYLTRSVFIALAPAAVLYLMLAMPGTTKKRFWQSLRYIGWYAAIIAPWGIISIMRHGHLHNLNYANIAFAIFDTSNSWLWFDTYVEKYPSGLSLFASHPLTIARHMAQNAIRFPVEIVLKQGYLAGAIVLLGLLPLVRRPSRERLVLLLNGASVLLLTFLAWLQPRFFVAVMPIILLFAAYITIKCIGQKLSSYWPRDTQGEGGVRRLPLRAFIISLTIVVATVAVAVRVPADFARANVEDEKQAGSFLLEHTPEGTALLTSSRNLAWYARRPFVSMNVLRDIAPDQLEKAVKATGARVFVYTKRHSIYTHPQLEYLLDPHDTRVPPSFRLIYKSETGWPVVAYWVEN